MKTPDFHELIGPDVSGEERERLRRAHDALVAVGPTPELPPRLMRPPQPPLALRSRRLLLAPAAALAAAAFAAGYVLGDSGVEEPAFAADFVLPMQGTPAAPSANAKLEVAETDDDGNRPMRMTVRNLPPLARGRYELFLTRGGRVVESCGTFRLERGETIVYLNAPYDLRSFDGWIVTRHGARQPLLTTERRGRGRGRGRGGDEDARTESLERANSGPSYAGDRSGGSGSSGSGSSGSGNGRSGSNSGSG